MRRLDSLSTSVHAILSTNLFISDQSHDEGAHAQEGQVSFNSYNRSATSSFTKYATSTLPVQSQTRHDALRGSQYLLLGDEQHRELKQREDVDPLLPMSEEEEIVGVQSSNEFLSVQEEYPDTPPPLTDCDISSVSPGSPPPIFRVPDWQDVKNVVVELEEPHEVESSSLPSSQEEYPKTLSQQDDVSMARQCDVGDPFFEGQGLSQDDLGVGDFYDGMTCGDSISEMQADCDGHPESSLRLPIGEPNKGSISWLLNTAPQQVEVESCALTPGTQIKAKRMRAPEATFSSPPTEGARRSSRSCAKKQYFDYSSPVESSEDDSDEETSRNKFHRKRAKKEEDVDMLQRSLEAREFRNLWAEQRDNLADKCKELGITDDEKLCFALQKFSLGAQNEAILRFLHVCIAKKLICNIVFSNSKFSAFGLQRFRVVKNRWEEFYLGLLQLFNIDSEEAESSKKLKKTLLTGLTRFGIKPDSGCAGKWDQAYQGEKEFVAEIRAQKSKNPKAKKVRKAWQTSSV